MTFHKLVEAIQNNYKRGLPKWQADPLGSNVRVLKRDRYRRMSSAEIQAILRHQHIWIPDYQHPEYQFDEEGLQTVCPNLSKRIDLHGKYHPYDAKPAGLTPPP